MLFIELSIVVALIFVNGLLAMSELALVSARRPLLEQMARAGSHGAGAALELTSEPGRFLSAVQVGITLVGIVAGAFSGVTLAGRGDEWLEQLGVPTRIAEPAAYVAVVAVITYLSVVVGELVPKQIGLRNAEPVAALVARPMQVFAMLAGPVVGLLDGSARTCLRLMGQGGAREQGVTDEEIRTLIAEAERTGLVDPEERSMIARVMRLADRSVRAVMTPRRDIEWFDLDSGEAEIRDAVRGAAHSRILATRGGIDDVAGAISVRPALVALLDGGTERIAGMVQAVPAVSDRLSAIDVVEQLRKSPLNMVLVVDEHGSIEGIVTEGDILKTVVADIEGGDGAQVTPRDDGSLLVDGSFPIDELAERLGMPLAAGHEYSTVAGFVLARMRRLPRIGETFRHGQWQFEVVDLDGPRIDKVLATPLPGLHRSA
jgi:putative hemolysin